ncbi:MAG TPA: hypothetical protein PK544_18705 [Spirochaetota bacterium]|nr:hypothetical protein [Spirochaetota bacterium]HPJ39015.1 hypothetical protein [Spirochaetota bacterium]HPQ55043.1 hypothetical protein [Spirochaetota bacterium]
MTLTSILPLIAGAGAAMFLGYTIIAREKKMKNGWIFPAVISIMFFGWSVFSAVYGGAAGFWVEHTRNYWGVQIWFDLLLAVCIGWFFIVPKAGALNMKLVPWGVLVLATGCIGFTAMVSRMLYLEEKAAR